MNAARKVHGIIDAAEWPPDKVDMEAFYCLFLSATPGKGTPASPLYTYKMQWVWLITGTDIQASQQQANRGDRYRTHLVMCEELRQGLYPNFGEKLVFSVDIDTGSLKSQSLDPQEYLWWSPGIFRHRVDDKSGLLYGFVDVSMNSWTGLITA